MNSATTQTVPAPSSESSRAQDWNEAIWLDRLKAVVGAERRGLSPVAAALPSMLVALDWSGTGRTLAALLPPADEGLSLSHLEYILPRLGFRTRRMTARGYAADTMRLRAGSLVQHGAHVAVYLGQPDGQDHWLVDGRPEAFKPAAGDMILVVDPDPDFHPVDESRPNWFRGLFEHMRDDIFAVFAMSTVINLMALAVPLYTLAIYSTIIPSGATGSIWSVALIATIAVLGAWGLRIARQFILSRIGGWAGIRIGEAAMRKMLSFPLDVAAKLGVHNNVIRLRGFENARQFLSSVGGANLIDYPFVAIFLLTIALLGGWLVLVPIVALLCFTAFAFPTADYVASKASAAGTAAARLEERAGAAFISIDAFYHAGSGTQWLGKFADLAREAALRNRDYAIALARAQAIGHALSMFTVLATMSVGVVLVLNGSMDAGGLVAALLLIWRITTPAEQAFGSLVRLRQVRSSVKQLDQLMVAPTERVGVEFASPFGLTRADVKIDRLYYRPDAGQEAALNGVSFSAPAGARVAIVGPNAGGKTAILECLAGLRRAQSGRILIGGRDIRQFDATEYRAWVGYVPQVVPALPVTVRDYLRLRAPALRDEEALRAFEQVIGPDWREIPTFASYAPIQRDYSGRGLLDSMLDPFSDTNADLKFRYLIAFVAATLGSPPLLLLDGVGLGRNAVWDARIERYLDSIHGRTTVIWTPYTKAHIQSSDQIVVIERGTVRRAGPAARPSMKIDERIA